MANSLKGALLDEVNASIAAGTAIALSAAASRLRRHVTLRFDGPHESVVTLTSMVAPSRLVCRVRGLRAS